VHRIAEGVSGIQDMNGVHAILEEVLFTLPLEGKDCIGCAVTERREDVRVSDGEY
jgi:hypothetical protein